MNNNNEQYDENPHEIFVLYPEISTICLRNISPTFFAMLTFGDYGLVMDLVPIFMIFTLFKFSSRKYNSFILDFSLLWLGLNGFMLFLILLSNLVIIDKETTALLILFIITLAITYMVFGKLDNENIKRE